MAEQALVAQAFDVRVMPMPSTIKAGCGFCLRFFPQDIERAAVFLTERGLEIKEAWKRDPDTGAYIKIEINHEPSKPH
ncbi:hypothetical protein FACS1894190_11150 [Spirochaetia bacterium]|nr:hypothetical protein FACS1894190_11150 [Spirochaetia bacterium]